jgi:hypothetical protein
MTSRRVLCEGISRLSTRPFIFSETGILPIAFLYPVRNNAPLEFLTGFTLDIMTTPMLED